MISRSPYLHCDGRSQINVPLHQGCSELRCGALWVCVESCMAYMEARTTHSVPFLYLCDFYVRGAPRPRTSLVAHSKGE